MKHKLQYLSLFLLAGLFFILGANTAQAQYENGALVGSIHDASGAAIPKSTVTATNTATGIVNTATSSATGDYEFPSLRIGLYTVRAEASGFSSAVAESISVTVAGRTRIDLSLKIGGSESTVEVSGVSLQLETETSERGLTISNYQSEALPLVSRNYSDLLALVPGSRQAPTAATTSSISSLVRAQPHDLQARSSFRRCGGSLIYCHEHLHRAFPDADQCRSILGVEPTVVVERANG